MAIAEALLVLAGMTSELDNRLVKNSGRLSVAVAVTVVPVPTMVVAGVVPVKPVIVVAG